MENKIKIVTKKSKDPLILRPNFLKIFLCLAVCLFTLSLFRTILIWPVVTLISISLSTIIVYHHYYRKSLIFKLRKFIEENHLYTDSMSARLGYFINQNLITIRYFKDANIFTERSDTFAKSFIALLDLPIIEINPSNTFVDYIFDTIPDKQLALNELKSNKFKIELTKKINWDIGSPPHLLISGNTNSGKTYLISMLILSYLKMGSDIRIIDPKNSDLSIIGRRIDLTKFGEQKNVGNEENEILEIIKKTHDDMEERYLKWFKDKPSSFGKTWLDFEDIKPIVLIIDEFSSFQLISDSKVIKEVQSYLASLLLKGRMAGIEIVLIQQRVDVTTNGITGSMRDQFGVRILMGRQKTESIKMMFGNPENIESVSHSNLTPGDGYVLIDGKFTQPTFFKSPLLPKDRSEYLEVLDDAILKNVSI